MSVNGPGEIHEIYRAGGFDPTILDGIEHLLGQDRMQRLFQITRAEFAEAMTRLRRAAAADDRAQVQSEAHALRGAAANVGAVAVADALARYESDLRDGGSSPTLPSAVSDAVAIADAALAKLYRGP